MALALIQGPPVEPVSLQEAKAHLRVAHDDEDALIEAYVRAATRHAESVMCWRAFVEQTLELTMDRFQEAISLPRPPLQEVISVKYVAEDNVERTVDSATYIVDTVSEPGRIIRAHGSQWPTSLYQVNAVKIRYKAGYPMEEVEVEGEAVGTGDDSETVFYLGNPRIVLDSETIYRDGAPVPAADYSLDRDTGTITFAVAPGEDVAITADYEYEDYRYNVPQEIKQGILILAGHFYEIREPVVIGTSVMVVPMTVEALLMPHRVWGSGVA